MVEAWLRAHPGVEIVCRDGSGAYGEAIRRALPEAVQVGDRWHIWRNLCDKTLAEVRSHSSCRATVNPPRPGGVREQTTRERRRQVHDLLDKGVGLLECARRPPHPTVGNDAKLTAWITDVRAVNLPYLHAFANGLELDRAAVDTALTLPRHNGRTEGVNTRTKRIMRQMHGRAGFPLLRHRILLP